MPAPRFKNFIRRRDRSIPLTGATRCGVHGDLKAVLNPLSDKAAQVSVDCPAVMIKTLKYVGASEGSSPAESMGVKAHALYEFLMSSARMELTEKTSFSVPFAHVKKFLQVDRTDRIREYMDALGDTWVSYDFTDKDGVKRIGRKIQLLQCAEAVMPDGTRHIHFSMHPDVRQVILSAKSYTWKELAAFAKFTSKYASRLYPILALRAGMSFEKPYPLVMKIDDLAAQLGWAYDQNRFKFSHFESRCLKPALSDIKEHVKRFEVLEYKPIHADTRGRPVTHVSLTVSHAMRPLEERQKAEVTEAQKRILPLLLQRVGLDVETELPSMDTLAQAATVLGGDVFKVGKRWVDVLKRARELPTSRFGKIGKATGQDLLDQLEGSGVGAAFALWMTDHEEYNPLAYDPLNCGVLFETDDEIEDFIADFTAEHGPTGGRGVKESDLEDYILYGIDHL